MKTQEMAVSLQTIAVPSEFISYENLLFRLRDKCNQ